MKLVSSHTSRTKQNIESGHGPRVPQRPVYQETPLTPAQRAALQNALQQVPSYKPVQPTVVQQPVVTEQPEPVQQPAMQTRPSAQPAMQTRPSVQQPMIRPARQHTQSRQASPQQNRTAATAAHQQHTYERDKPKRSAKNVVLTLLIVIILAGAGFAGWFYWWTTYAVFDYQLQPVVILQGQDIKASDFLYPGTEMEQVEAVFRRPGNRNTEGRQDIPLLLTMGWRTVEAVATLVVLTPVEHIYNEFTVAGPELKPVDFITNADTAYGIPFDVHFIAEPLPLEDYAVGEFTLHLALNGALFDVKLTVLDTTPPTATATNKTIQIGEDVVPMDFVTDIYDASAIASVSFIEEPDVFSLRDQIIEIVIEDIYGNSDVFASSLTILLNIEPPVFQGIDTVISMLGNPIMYRQGVSAFDDFGRELEFEVDSSAVNQDAEGIYTVRYWTIDHTGLRTDVEAVVHVLDIDIDYVNEEVDKALRSIITNNMTQLQMVRAIHEWVRRNINYANVRGGPTTAYEGAYRALRDRRGNCYIFYSISELMLTRAGIDNMRIERIPGTSTNHRWNLVNPDGLGWHHFDSFPTRLTLGTRPMAFFTATQAEQFTRQIANFEERPMRNYYTYDPALYPEIVR